MTSNNIGLRCPGNCMKKDPKTNKEIGKGYLEEIVLGSNRFFCTTPGCQFGFQDENQKDQWIGGAIPLNLPNEDGLN